MNLYNLTARLTLDTTDYDKKIKDTKKTNEDFAEKVKKFIGVVSANAWVQLGKAIFNVGKQIAQVAKQTIDYADKIGDLAQQWGFTTKEIQEFNYWATMNGTTLESLLTGMRGLVNQAEAGSDAFKQLGVEVKNTDGTLKSQKQLFLETIDALQRIPNLTQRNALQFEIFGRAGIELGQIINRSSEELEALSKQAENLGLIMSEEVSESAGAFNDILDRLKLQGKTAFAELVLGIDGADRKFETFIDNIMIALQKLQPAISRIGTQLGIALIEGLGKAIVDKLWGTIKWALGEGWIWGDKKYDGFNEWLVGGFTHTGGLFQDEPVTSIFDTTNNANKTDNSSYNIEINMTSSGYTKEDARNLVDDVIKEISTKKQASGR